MRKILLSLFILLSLKSYCQSKTDTEQWIKDKIENLSFELHTGSDYTGITVSVSFDNCVMKITTLTNVRREGTSQKVTIIREIPLKDLYKPTFNTFSGTTSLTFRTKTPNNIKINVTDLNKISYVSQESINFLKKDFQNDLQNRLSKAFINLIKLCGGQTTKEIF